MVKQFITILSLCLYFTTHGQIKFFNTYSNAGFDKGEGICQLADSSYLLVGTSTSFFEGPSQFFIARIDSLGNLIWSRDAGGSEVDNGKRILTIDSTFYSFGTSSSNASGDFDFQIVTGNIIGHIYGGIQLQHQGWDFLNDAILLPDSTFLLAGYTRNSADGKKDAYLVKTDTLGNVLFNLQSNSLNDDEVTSVEVLDGSTFLVAGYRYNADSSFIKAYVQARELNGSLLWDKEYGDIGNSKFADVLATIHGIYGTGSKMRMSDSLWQEYFIRLDFQGGIVEENFGYADGEKWPKQLVHLGGFNYFLAIETDDIFTFGEGTDVSYFSFNESLDYQGSNVSVQVDKTDIHGQAIPTSDGGFVAIGSTQQYGSGELSVYVLKAFKNDYPNMSLPTQSALVGVKEEINLEAFLYPNPVRNQLHIVFENQEEGRIILFDLSGKRVQEYKLTDKHTLLDLSDLQTGLFLLQIQTEKGTVTHRLVKE